jgi:hypothetical protein
MRVVMRAMIKPICGLRQLSEADLDMYKFIVFYI